ncbi:MULTISPECIES: hypothetical protein [unclassified Flavobacterium]|nr:MULTISPECIES: hypothetical protein [unclassified Flavobacterium]KOP39613.1 hypothetical protein AKO67_03400 [Flavobacterium sp. VMW]OWU90164.1 hypothetical protein APR43_13880 [Flavobacterium sp. NLM]
MTNDKTLKNKIASDWQTNFSELTVFSQNKFYKMTGPLVFGIDLVKLPRTNEYRPYFVLYPLWKKSVKECLDVPIVLQEFFNKKDFQFDIPYEYDKHLQYFNEVSQIIKKQYPLLLEKNIHTQSIIKTITDYSKTKRFSLAPLSYFQAEFLQVKMKIALYKSMSEAQKILDDIKKINWDQSHFQACGVNLSDWLNSLQNEIDNQDQFLKQIEINKSDKKIQKLINSELI